MSQKDITEKMLFTYNDVFADVVNALLFKGEQVIAEEELVDQAPRAAYKADGVIRDIERDVAKRWLKNNIRIACIGIICKCSGYFTAICHRYKDQPL